MYTLPGDGIALVTLPNTWWFHCIQMSLLLYQSYLCHANMLYDQRQLMYVCMRLCGICTYVTMCVSIMSMRMCACVKYPCMRACVRASASVSVCVYVRLLVYQGSPPPSQHAIGIYGFRVLN